MNLSRVRRRGLYFGIRMLGSASLLYCGIGLAPCAFAADPPGDELVAMVLSLLNEKDKDLRAVGLEQVRTEAKGAAATNQFAAQLPKLPPEAQVGLLSALADRGDRAARPAVLALYQSASAEPVKVAAIEALGPLGETADLKLLIPLLSAPAKAEQAAARASLVRLQGEDVAAAIATESKQGPTPQRVALIEILATRHALDTLPVVLAAAVDNDPVVRAAAMTALGQVAGPEAIPGMLQGVLKAKPGSERVAAEKNIMFVCLRDPDTETRAAPLLAAMEKLPTSDRLTLLPTLGRVGGSAALKVVEATIADPSAERHEIGLRALCNWPDASVAPRLVELAQKDKHPEHQSMALAALIRVAPLPDKRPPSERLELLTKVIGMCTDDGERNLALKRASAIRTIETLRFILPYLDKPPYAQQACETVVELAHHRELREPNKAEFDPALDKVIQISKNPIVIDRANRYKKGQTWVKANATAQP